MQNLMKCYKLAELSDDSDTFGLFCGITCNISEDSEVRGVP